MVSFAGPSYAIAVVPAAAREVLAHYDAESAHYELVAGMGVLTPPALAAPARP